MEGHYFPPIVYLTARYLAIVGSFVEHACRVDEDKPPLPRGAVAYMIVNGIATFGAPPEPSHTRATAAVPHASHAPSHVRCLTLVPFRMPCLIRHATLVCLARAASCVLSHTLHARICMSCNMSI